jgi:hypothetical protein
VDRLADCCVDVGGSEPAGLGDVGNEVLDFHCRLFV